MTLAPVIILFLQALAAAAQNFGRWNLETSSPSSRDFYFQAMVDPGVSYAENESCARWEIQFYLWAPNIPGSESQSGWIHAAWMGRVRGDYNVEAWIIGAKDTNNPRNPPGSDYFHGGEVESTMGPTKRISGAYPWYVGHQYRIRLRHSLLTESEQLTGTWWQFTIKDLYTGEELEMGEIKTDQYDMSRNNQFQLNTYCGARICNVQRHTYILSASPKGNLGTISEVSGMEDTTRSMTCPNIIPGMTEPDWGAKSWFEGTTFHAIDNQYRGIHQYGNYDSVANEGMMFVADLNETFPYMYRALHDGKYGPFPERGKDNADWKSVGQGYPIINDLFFRKQRLYLSKERSESYPEVGDFFVRRVCSEAELEYYVMLRKNPGPFPPRRTHNADWRYVGRHAKATDPAHQDD